MARRTDQPRDTATGAAWLFRDKAEKDRLEARNGLLQFDEALGMIDRAIQSPDQFVLSVEALKRLHYLAIKDIYRCAGNLRNHDVTIGGTDHEPPPTVAVPRLLDEMCIYVNTHSEKANALHHAAYVMWRLNWIHPFAGGNGRTSRTASYLVLSARLRQRLTGTDTIPDQITRNRQPYYAALDAADAAWKKGSIDVSEMESLIADFLARQLSSPNP